MPGVRCSVAFCKNSKVVTKRCPTKKDIQYHRFPKNKELRSIWEKSCRRSENWKFTDHSKICSAHFLPEDFQRNLRAELLNLNVKKLLKKDAVPSILLQDGDFPPPCDKRKIEEERRQNKLLVAKLLKGKSSQNATPLKPASASSKPLNGTTPDDATKSFTEKTKFRYILSKPTITTISDHPTTPSIDPRDDLLDLRRKCYLLERDKAVLERKVASATKSLSMKTKALTDARKELRELRMKQKKTEKVIRKESEALRQLFSESQINMLVNKKQRAHWDDRCISQAMALRCISRRAYSFLRDKLKFPLPGVSTLQHYEQMAMKQEVIIEYIDMNADVEEVEIE